MWPPHLQFKVRAVKPEVNDSPVFWDFVSLSKLVRLVFALYAVPVRRPGTLPSASFRFHLAVDTLAVQLTLPTAIYVADFHRQVTAHAGHTKETAKQFQQPRKCGGEKTAQRAQPDCGFSEPEPL
jgi:hypothetical protein